MRILKNILIGFAVSFIGSIPLGYLNLIGYQIYSTSNFNQLSLYLFGVLIVEAIVIYTTLKLSSKVSMNPKWKNYISIFSFLFLLGIAILTYNSSANENNALDKYNSYLSYSAVISGIILSCINVAQVPFWMSWNLYLTNENYIISKGKLGLVYVLGTVIGTYFGMLAIIFSIQAAKNKEYISPNFFSKYIWVIFLVLATFQLFQIIRNNFKSK
jgi:threonine/homoserine/homoserine lactone efflux protein